MKHFMAIVVGTGLLATSQAAAETAPFGDGSYLTGYVELGYVNRSVTDDWFYRGDLDLGVSPGDTGSGAGLGFSLGLDAYGGNMPSRTALYAAVEVATPAGKFSIGAPRSVLDRGLLPEPKFAYGSFVDLELRGVLASYVGFNYLTTSETTLGLRYDAGFGNTRLGFSAHNIAAAGGDEQAYALALSHTLPGAGSIGDVMLYGGAEHVVTPGTSATSFRIGAEARMDRTRIGLTYADNEIPFGATFAYAYADYDITRQLTLNASYGRVDPGTPANVYGLGVEYRFLDQGYAKASYVDSDRPGFNPIWEATLGWQF